MDTYHFYIIRYFSYYQTIMEAPRDAGIGKILILAGLPFYYYWNKNE
ncbi:MAG: hypothetical protein CM1200mP1_05490 [Candidatus Neomarinimicrobiota bacterium]|nr:MAG: hypothetical protein CM1200mP1_05490 [Candidatus Neomarinimicrobiota bacterium]